VKCPKCKDELVVKKEGGQGLVVLDVCPSCEGAWFDKGELDSLDDSVHTNVEELSFEPATRLGEIRYTCPRCDVDLEPLSPKEDEDLVVDHCPKCGGFWLDPGELDWIRRIALELDEREQADMKPISRPADWSWLKWAAYSLWGRRA
jgi:uncharacterized protein